MNTSDEGGVAPGVPEADLRALLLHRLPEAQAEALEQRLLTEAGLAERVRQLEHELLDDHARDRLGPAEREEVRRWLLRTPADRQRLGVARALAGMKAPAATVRPAARRKRMPLLAAASLLAGVAAAALLLARHNGAAPVQPDAAAVAAAQGEGPMYTVSLLASASRGEPEQSLPVPRGTARIRLQLEVEQPDPAASYELQVSDGAGHPSFSVAGLALQHAGAHAYVETVLPAAVLMPQAHRITLRGGPAAQAPWTLRLHVG